ncbi:hypothetical protein Dimus_028894, partial [Dionaea muscipula]
MKRNLLHSLDMGLLASLVKSSSRSSSIVVLGSAFDKFRSSNLASSIPVGKQVHPKVDNNSKKDKPDSNLTRDEDENGPLEMTLQERSKSSSNRASRMLNQSRMYHRYASKHSPVDEKDPARLTSTKASSVESHRRRSSSVEPARSLQNQGANKRTASALQLRGQRVLSNSQSSSQATYSTSGRTPVSTNCLCEISSSGMTINLLVVVVSFFVKDAASDGSALYNVCCILAIAGVMCMVVTFSLGMGAIPRVIMSECSCFMLIMLCAQIQIKLMCFRWVSCVFTYDAVGSYERVGYSSQGSGAKLIMPFLDNQLKFPRPLLLPVAGMVISLCSWAAVIQRKAFLGAGLEIHAGFIAREGCRDFLF